MIYLVLGMHKSGTTLISSILHKSGINMGSDIEEKHLNYDDKKGESKYIREINDALLNSGGVVSLYIDDSELHLNEDLELKIKDFVESHSLSYDNWGFKDPRTVLTIDIWKHHLEEFKSVVVFRNPKEVAKHYSKTSKNPWVIIEAIQTWKKYNKKIINNIEDGTIRDYVLLDFGSLMNDQEELTRLERYIGKPLEDNRKKSLYKSKKTNSFITISCRLLGATSLYEKLCKLRKVQIEG